MRLFRPLLRQVWEYSRYYLFWVCGSTPISAIPLFAGVLPQKCCSASGSTPIIKKQSVGPLLREYSRKSGPTILQGVLPKRLFLYTGSDLDMIYNLDILLPPDTLGVLPELFFWFLGVLSILLFLYNKHFHFHWQKISLLGVLQETKKKSTGSTPSVSSGSNISRL